MTKVKMLFRSAVSLLPWLALAGASASADNGVSFSAEVDRQAITADESVSLKFRIQSDGARMSGVQAKFDAPGFDELNSYESSFVESYYQNGTFGVRNNKTITKVLRPRKDGVHEISGIQVTVNGQIHTAPPIRVTVSPSGAGTPPPRGYSAGGGGLSAAKRPDGGREFFVRAEVSKPEVYKGEQLIVSYYLYRQVRVFNIQVVKYPVLTGFLREELEMPIQGRRLESESVVLNGVPYQRSLLVRYAAYPLKEGRLRIDPMSIKANYYPQTRGTPTLDEDDPLAPFSHFFQQMNPRVANRQSKSVPVEVKALPLAGRPASFTGAVGNFDVVSMVDKYQVRVNEPITLTVKVEGRGNTAAISDPNAKWPSSLELYESKKNARNSAGGVSEKIFEYLLIPREAGEFELPPLEFGFFDPEKEQYVVRTTAGIRVRVLPSASGAVVAPRTDQAPVAGAGSVLAGKDADLRYLKPPVAPLSGLAAWAGGAWWRWGYGLAALALLAFGVLVGRDFVFARHEGRKSARAERGAIESKRWKVLRGKAEAAATSSWQEVVQVYEGISGALLDEIDRAFGISSRSLPRAELEARLVDERKLDASVWQRASSLLEYAEAVRYAASAGVVSETEARASMKKWIHEGEQLARALISRTDSKT